MRIEYNGLIQQMSGEDWSDVKLTLSTASPALSAAGPGLAPFRLTLVPGAPLNAAPFAGAGGMGMGGPDMSGFAGQGMPPQMNGMPPNGMGMMPNMGMPQM